MNVKITDFGLSKYGDYYKAKSSRPMPFEWMAIESIERGRYDTKTDVWSFGVLVWELLTNGSVPYINIDNDKLLNKLKNGYRLEKPNNCPDEIY